MTNAEFTEWMAWYFDQAEQQSKAAQEAARSRRR
jgi:hypothetical protein